MPRKLVPSHVKSAILHYAQNSGLTQKRIAELTGVSERSVYRVLQQHGELKHAPRVSPELAKAVGALAAFNLTPANVPVFLETLKMMGVDVIKTADSPNKIAVRIPHNTYNITKAQLIKAAVEMEAGTWNELLSEIVTARVAKAHNVGVQTAMLNLSNAVDKNAKTKQ